MPYPLLPWQRPPAKPPPRPAPLAAPLPAGLAAEFDDRPFGTHGEAFPAPTPGGILPGAEKVTFPPPDWEAEKVTDVGNFPEPPPGPQSSAAEAMMAGDYQPADWQPPPDPYQPLLPCGGLEPPPPDWRLEEP